MNASYLMPVLLLVLVIVMAVVRSRAVHPYVKQMQQEDGDDPLKRWARGVWAVISGPPSPQLRGVADCQNSLKHSWEIHSGEEALGTIGRLSQVPTGQVAWDLVRTVMVARLAAGADYLSMEEAQAAVGNIQGPLQTRYADWEAMSAAYDAAAIERGFDGEWRTRHRPAAREIWKVVPFK